MIQMTCGEIITEEDYKALSQPERKRLGEIARQLMKKDRCLIKQQALKMAYPLVLSESVEDEY
jgi:hypothetical protein